MGQTVNLTINVGSAVSLGTVHTVVKKSVIPVIAIMLQTETGQATRIREQMTGTTFMEMRKRAL